MRVNSVRIATGVLLVNLVAGGHGNAGAQAGPERGLETLTVPPGRLTAGCRLKPPEPPRSVPGVAEGTRTVVTSGGSEPSFATNPWIGQARQDVLKIRRVVDGVPREPDGPPLDGRETAAYRLRWADHVVEAYRAAYVSSEGADIDVFAVRFDDDARAGATAPAGVIGLGGALTSRVVIGPIVALVSTRPANSCFDAIRGYVQSLR